MRVYPFVSRIVGEIQEKITVNLIKLVREKSYHDIFMKNRDFTKCIKFRLLLGLEYQSCYILIKKNIYFHFQQSKIKHSFSKKSILDLLSTNTTSASYLLDSLEKLNNKLLQSIYLDLDNFI